METVSPPVPSAISLTGSWMVIRPAEAKANVTGTVTPGVNGCLRPVIVITPPAGWPAPTRTRVFGGMLMGPEPVPGADAGEDEPGVADLVGPDAEAVEGGAEAESELAAEPGAGVLLPLEVRTTLAAADEVTDTS